MATHNKITSIWFRLWTEHLCIYTYADIHVDDDDDDADDDDDDDGGDDDDDDDDDDD